MQAREKKFAQQKWDKQKVSDINKSGYIHNHNRHKQASS